MSEPSRFDDTFVAGDSYPLMLTLVGEDVTGYQAKLFIRRNVNEEPILILDAAIGNSNGLIIFKLEPHHTSLLDNARDGFQKFVYSVLVNNGSTIETLMIGYFRVLRNISNVPLNSPQSLWNIKPTIPSQPTPAPSNPATPRRRS